MKKAAAFYLTILFALCLMAGSALASGFNYTFTDYTGDVTYTGNTDKASAVMLFDADSGVVLYQKNIDETIEPASTTKIMTLIVALENGDMDSAVTVSPKAAGMSGSHLEPKLKNGEKVIFKDLINGMMLASGNEAATAVAETVGGSVDGFVTMMNTKASEIGMTHTTFTTPHGIHAEGHVTTARDMAILTAYALQNPEFVKIVGQETYTMPSTNKYSRERVVKNTNKLLRTEESSYYYSNATGVKTGSTPYAGDCLVSSASKDGMNLVCLIFKVPENDPARWPIAKSLFEWGFENFETVDFAKLLEKTKTEPIQEAVENVAVSDSGLLDFNAPKAGSAFVTLDKATAEGLLNDTDKIEAETTYNVEYPLQAPIAKDDLLGTVIYKSANTGKIIYQASLIASRDVPALGTEPNVSGNTPVDIQTPTTVIPNKVVKDNGNLYIFILIGIAGALIVFLVIRMLTANRRKHKRFKSRQPHYSYKIRKR